MWKNVKRRFEELTDFSNDPYGLKSVVFFIILLFIGFLIWDWLSLDSGRGGSPYGDPDYYYNEL